MDQYKSLVTDLSSNLRLTRSVAIGALSLVVFLMLSIYGVFILNDDHTSEQKVKTQYWVDSFVTRIEGRIESNIAVGHGVAAQVSVMPDMTQTQFERVVRRLLSKPLDVRHLAIAPDLVISAVYPLEGNEAAVGLDYRAHPTQRAAALETLRNGTVVLAGPIKLVQGADRQLVARIPVYTEADEAWGLVAVVIEVDRVLVGVGIDRITQDYNVYLEKIDNKLEGAQAIFGQLQDVGTRPLSKRIHLPGSTWRVYFSPKSEWGLNQFQWVAYLSIAVLASLCLALLIFFMHRNITLKKEHIIHLRSMLAIDPITKLTSRYQFNVNLAELVQECSRTKGKFTVLMVDVDHFKEVNDSLGHIVGDAILVELAGRLKACIRPYDLVCRLSGDEFVVVLKSVSSAQEIEKRARAIMKEISVPVKIANNEVNLTCSIGVSVYPNDAYTAESLIQHADLAMYESKRIGRNSVFFFDVARRDQADRFVKLTGEIKSALEEHQFNVYFQPIFSLADGSFSHCEALCRWQKETGEFVSPVEFIGVAERSGMIAGIGQIVVEKTLAAIDALSQQGLDIRFSINRSPSEFVSDDATEKMVKLLESSPQYKDKVIFEITESLFMSDNNAKLANFWKMKRSGIHFAIDDFGTGYSSINYLRQFPVEYLKIDRSFILGIEKDTVKGPELVRIITQMAKSLNMKVIAEGVETEEQVQFLSGVGCDYIQGYYYAKPMPLTDLVLFLDEKKVNASRATY